MADYTETEVQEARELIDDLFATMKGHSARKSVLALIFAAVAICKQGIKRRNGDPETVASSVSIMGSLFDTVVTGILAVKLGRDANFLGDAPADAETVVEDSNG